MPLHGLRYSFIDNPEDTMTERIDDILKKFTDPKTGSFHGLGFIAIDSKGTYRGLSLSLGLGRAND